MRKKTMDEYGKNRAEVSRKLRIVAKKMTKEFGFKVTVDIVRKMAIDYYLESDRAEVWLRGAK